MTTQVLALAPHHGLLPHALRQDDDGVLHRRQVDEGQVPLPREKRRG